MAVIEFEQRKIDVLALAAALAREQRRLDGDDAIEPGEEIADRDARLLRRPLRLAGDAHDSRHALNEEVVAGALGVRAGLAEAGHRAVDEPRIERLQALVVEPELLQTADLEILKEHIGARREPAHDLAPPVGGEISDNRAFAAIARVEIGGRFLPLRFDEGRTPAARLVALRTLDLDDVGAEIGERLSGGRAREHARELDDAQSRKGARAQKNACRPVCARPRISA